MNAAFQDFDDDAPQLMRIDVGPDSAQAPLQAFIAPADSAAADSLAAVRTANAAANTLARLDGTICRTGDASTEFELNLTTGRPEFYSGMPAQPLPVLPGYDTGVAALVLGVFLLLALNMKGYTTFLKSFAQDLWSLRSRDNVFEDHTVSETRVLISLVMLVCLSEGILLFTAFRPVFFGYESPFVGVGMLTLLCGLYYLWQTAAYSTVGAVFSTPDGQRQWLRGFNASQVLLGLLLWVPALVVLFNPGLGAPMLAVGASLYVLARIIFISKGFRIFYNNLFSLVYFILYLCSLETIPVILVYKATRLISQI